MIGYFVIEERVEFCYIWVYIVVISVVVVMEVDVFYVLMGSVLVVGLNEMNWVVVGRYIVERRVIIEVEVCFVIFVDVIVKVNIDMLLFRSKIIVIGSINVIVIEVLNLVMYEVGFFNWYVWDY